MRESRLAAALSRRLPAAVRDELYRPAEADLRIDCAGRLRQAPAPVRRAAITARYHVEAVLLVLECWRLSLPDRVHRRREERQPRRPKEILLLLTYTVRHALRLLLREPAFAITAAATLALGLGFNLAVFAVVEAVILRPLPYAAADELVVLRHMDRRTGLTKDFIAIGDYIDLRAKQTMFEGLSSYGGGSATITGAGEPYRADVLQAGPGLLDLLKVTAAHGRSLQPDDSRPGAPPVAMISQSLWERQFGSDPAVIGRTIGVGPSQRQIVGVAPRGFRFPAGADTEVIIPATLPPAAPANRKSGWVFSVARLEPGVSLPEGTAHLEALSRGMEAEFPQENTGSLYYPVSLRDHLLGDTRRPLMLLLGSVAVVLLIACANVGNLLLARALGRRQEMSVRAALGAGRGRLILQLLVESLVLTLLAGAAGLALAYWSVPLLLALVPERLAVPGLADAGLNPKVFACAFALCVATAVGFAVLSAATIRLGAGAGTLTSQTRVSGSRGARRAASALIVAEVALSVVLLMGAGLILRSFSALLSVDPGFHIDRVATVEVVLPQGAYRDVAARQAFYQRAFEALGTIPGVRAAGAAAVVPLTGNNWTVPFERADRPVPAGTRPPDVGWQSASAGYFKALGIPLLAGRLFDARDAASATPGVIISEAIEKQFFDGESAIGRKVRTGDGTVEIVGVVGNIRRAALNDSPRADMYFPFERVPSPSTTLFIEATGDAKGILPAAREVLRTVEPAIVIPEMRTLTGIAQASVASTRLVLWLLGAFAIAAVILAGIGVYGVMAYVVRRRSREFGTRIALGAGTRDILVLVLREGGTMTAAGLGIGALCGLLLSQSLSSLLYGVKPSDPVTLGAALAVLSAATMSACYLPARRATRVDAARALGSD